MVFFIYFLFMVFLILFSFPGRLWFFFFLNRRNAITGAGEANGATDFISD